MEKNWKQMNSTEEMLNMEYEQTYVDLYFLFLFYFLVILVGQAWGLMHAKYTPLS